MKTKLLLEPITSFDMFETQQEKVICFDFVRQSVEWSPFTETISDRYLKIRSLTSILVDFLNGVIDFDSLLLSQKAYFTRSPDDFDSDLHNLLKYGTDTSSLQALLEFHLGEKYQTEHFNYTDDKGLTFLIPNHCPHEGQLLSERDVVNNCITCPRHRWEFELSTGKCIKGNTRTNLYQEVRQHE